MDQLLQLFDSIIEQYRTLDIAESEFKRMADEDPEILAAYKQWCEESGSSERNGFKDYFDEYKDSHDSIWDSLNDPDE